MTELIAARSVHVRRVIAEPPAPSFAGAIWIGSVDVTELDGRLELEGAHGYRSARLLVRAGRIPLANVHVPIIDGGLDGSVVRDLVDELPPVVAPAPLGITPPISVVLCTYDRPGLLRSALDSLLRLDYPDYELVVVDNHPGHPATRAVLESYDDPRLRWFPEPAQGLARARNTGAAQARHHLVAFTDDDVTVDPQWLLGIADGFAVGPNVACVCGLVPTAELDSPAQGYFDRRVSWARSMQREVFSLAGPPPGERLFPFQVARFGTGANFAVRKEALERIGGFDEGLGAGSTCGGGEDIDIFVRMLLAGQWLAREPSAIVWHRHRPGFDTLKEQIEQYGVGLGAWLATLLVNPRALAMIVRRALPGIVHLREVSRTGDPSLDMEREFEGLWRTERRAVLKGPWRLLRARLSGAKSRPIRRFRPATSGAEMKGR